MHTDQLHSFQSYFKDSKGNTFNWVGLS